MRNQVGFSSQCWIMAEAVCLWHLPPHPYQWASARKSSSQAGAQSLNWSLKMSKVGTVIGVDGCKDGWFYVELSEAGSSYGVVRHIDELLERASKDTCILIDIPIGLIDKGDAWRQCDAEARKLLGWPRLASVFRPPVRPALQEPNYQAASACNRRLSGKGLSKQAYAIAPKIQEVDDLLRRDSKARSIIREVHPELCFWGLSGGQPMEFNKKTTKGFEERMAVLSRHYPESQDLVEKAVVEFPRKRVAKDDIIDAMVAAVTGRMRSQWCTLPAEPQADAHRLPMEMVYVVAK
ncbi:MAG: DUF429 domain-containing protein [Halieaceae bacterium]|jgi:predicted RNase H-like nuclease|nr:DUF429 domain-containing protein [Halieaceae bacterium]